MMKNFKANSLDSMNNFKLVWSGQFISLMGTAMTKFALLIWAYQQTSKATTTALLGFAAVLPIVLLSPLAGVLIDRIDRKKVMALADLGAGIVTVAVFILYSTGKLQVCHLYLAEAFTGACEAFQVPAYSSAITLLIPKEQYSRANGMVSLARSSAQISAPILAGILMPAIGIRGIMVIDIISFLLAISALIVAKIPNPELNQDKLKNNQHLSEGFWFGLKYLLNHKGLFWLMLIFLIINFLSGITYFGILPALILARSADNQLVLAWVQASLGAGGIIGSLIISIWGGPKRNVLAILLSGACSFLFGDLFLAIGSTVSVWVIAAFLSSFFIPLINAGQNVLFQSKIEPGIQGRVFSIRNMFQQAFLPIGYLLGGYLADNIFEPVMTTNTVINHVFKGLVGSGKGSGMALMFLVTGILGAITCLSGFLFKGLRNLETSLPD